MKYIGIIYVDMRIHKCTHTHARTHTHTHTHTMHTSFLGSCHVFPTSGGDVATATGLLVIEDTLPLISEACSVTEACDTLDSFPPPRQDDSPNFILAATLGVLVPVVVILLLVVFMAVLYYKCKKRKYYVSAGLVCLMRPFT